MKKVSGTLNGTGAAITVSLGFVPDFVKIWNLDRTNPATLEWNVNMRSAAQIGGISTASDATQNVYTRYTEGAGIDLHSGGTLLSAASTVYLFPTEEVIGQGDVSKKGETITTAITGWTSDTPGSRTGSFSAIANTTYAGIGSRMRVYNPLTKATTEAVVMVLSSNGEAADEVETNVLVPTGTLQYLGPMYDYIGGVAGQVTKAGFTVNTTGDINTSGEAVCFEAGTYL
jgi:hypothetical protein